MKINWTVRFKNPYFWLGLLGVILSTLGVKPEMFTSWEILFQQVKEVLSNPFLIGSLIVAILGVLSDPTTKGLSDSPQALTYDKPKKE